MNVKVTVCINLIYITHFRLNPEHVTSVPLATPGAPGELLLTDI